ncbi:unnamed protein product [Moneuplotes crassus]|uniref:Uncharacterized protein n=1 Tax=Euplotes crassus TaxID=5936 RepID=A0AAD1XDL5_EUPCR|nr:unnamed protein product [Moneuplotes crassus]
MLGGTPLNIWALTMADQTLLSALAPFSIIFTLVLGRFMLKEEILLKHYISCFFMSVGSILALIFASKHSETLKIQEIQSRILSTISIITTTTNIILLTLLLLLSFKIIRDIKVASKSFTDTQMNQCLLKDNYLQSIQRSDFTRDSETLRVTVEISEFQEETQGQFFCNPHWLKLAVFAFPWFSGFMSGMTSLFAKCTIMTFSHLKDNSSSALTFIIPILLLVTAIGEIVSLNLGFKYFDTAIVVPIFKASIVFHNTMCGGLLLQEFFNYNNLNIMMYIVGITICIIGILIMLLGKDSSKPLQKKLKIAGQEVNQTLLEEE